MSSTTITLSTRASGLSTLEFREGITRGNAIGWRLIAPEARPGYKYFEKAVDYYRRGTNEWYLWWGNNAFEYDGHPVVSMLSVSSRSLGQLSAIAVGMHPPDSDSARPRE